MVTTTRDNSKGRLAWVVGGLIVAALVIAAYVFASRNQQPDLPRASDLNVEMPTPPTMPDTPTLPPAPIPAPR
ncbi:MAG TPA: hypothetical protein VIO94_08615 [Phenylobacterium sp.]